MLNAKLEKMCRGQHKIGVLVPFTNVNLEPDMQLLCPSDCTMHSERLGGYDADKIPGSDQMAGLGSSDLSSSLRLIMGIRPAAILYGCTSATLTHGSAFDRELATTIEKFSTDSGQKTHCITAADALATALTDKGFCRIGFSSPYLGEINEQAVAFLADRGIETVVRADIGRELDNYGQGMLTPREVYELAMKVDSPDIDAIVLSCTDMRSVEVIDALEADTGKPVVTSNQAMIYQLCRLLRLDTQFEQGGRLLKSPKFD